ncbi:MAG: D-arabinono-1,4-lactone oxidase [Microthrixaceae bacterium]
MASIWSNWAGNQRALVDVVRPTTEHEICEIVKRARVDGVHVKAVGAGHSFSDTATTNGVLLSLEDYGRVLDLDVEAGLLTVQAGAQLHAVSRYLWSRGFAIENLGDIDVQSLAGATSTATHGTGRRFRNLSAGIVGMRIVDGSGEIVDIDTDNNQELLSVAPVGVGALGIISTITLQVVPAFNLHAIEEPRRLDDVIENFDDLVAENDHFEFFYVPHTGWTLTKTNRRNNDVRNDRSRFARWRNEELIANGAFGLANRVGRRRPSLVPDLARRVPSVGRVEYNEPSFQVFASPRKVRFVEMEYAVPLEATLSALSEVRSWIDSTGSPTMFPIEVRAVEGDDVALSTAHGRPSGYIAVHTYKGTPYERYFHAVEDIMKAHDGRPHWGKLHFRSSSDLAPVYPRWDDFIAARARLDPGGVFENAYTRRCFGPVAR